TQWDVLEYIEAAQMRLWGRSDRIGARLAESIGTDGNSIVADQMYVLDIELWHRGTSELAQQMLGELRRVVDDNRSEGESLSDTFAGELLCLARVRVRGEKLSQILELDAVAEADLPAQPVFDPRQAARVTPRDFPPPPFPPKGGPRVCIIDSGIASNHPLLAH